MSNPLEFGSVEWGNEFSPLLDSGATYSKCAPELSPVAGVVAERIRLKHMARVANALPGVKDTPPEPNINSLPMEETMGERIKRLREAKGMSQEALGNLMGDMLGRPALSKATVSKWELGTTTYIREIVTLAEALGTDPQYLRWGPDRSPKPLRKPATPSSKAG